MKIIALPGLKIISTKKNKPFPLLLPFGLLIAAYYLLHSNYNIFNVDDSWTISNTWNLINRGIAKDLVFIDSGKLGYQQFFGFSYHYVMGTLLNILGWTKSNIFLINSFFIGLATLCWWHILKELPFTKTVARLSVAFMPLFPPFFFAAHSGRVDAMIVFLISTQFLLFIKKQYLPAFFLLGLSMEVHPMGVVGLFFMLAYALYKRSELLYDKPQLLKLLAGALLGSVLSILYYFGLHWKLFHGPAFLELLSKKSDMASPLNNYIFNYFATFNWLSHIWEMILLITTLILYFKKGIYKKNRFLTILLTVLVISTLITRRENSVYLVFIYPVFILLFFYTFEQVYRLRAFATLLILSLCIYYGITYYKHHDFNFDRITQKIHVALDDHSKPVVGMADIWFAAKERTFIPIHYHRDFSSIDFNEFYLIETAYLKNENRMYSALVNYFQQNFECTIIKTIPAYEEKVVRVCECSNSKKHSVPQLISVEAN